MILECQKWMGLNFILKRKLDSKVKVCFLTASDISEEFKKGMFADELDNTQDKICFITIPIENDDLRKRIRELLELK